MVRIAENFTALFLVQREEVMIAKDIADPSPKDPVSLN